MVKSKIKTFGLLLFGNLSITSPAYAQDIFQTVLQDQIFPHVSYKVTLSKPINNTEYEQLLALAEKIQLKPFFPKDITTSGLVPTAKNQDSEDLINLIKETLGPDYNVKVIPLKSMLMSTQEEWKF